VAVVRQRTDIILFQRGSSCGPLVIFAPGRTAGRFTARGRTCGVLGVGDNFGIRAVLGVEVDA
jgi:hypothetical protein